MTTTTTTTTTTATSTKRISIVTGATTGIGLEIARNLARTGHLVVIGCRDAARGERARANIVATVDGADVVVMRLDVASQSSIRAFAAAAAARFDRVDVLVNNAGGWFAKRELTVDGVEKTWATNVLSVHLLTKLLYPLLARARGRVVNVGSHLSGKLDLSDVENAKRPYAGFDVAYQASKQALHMLTVAQAHNLDGVTDNAAGPGWVRTEAHRTAHPVQRFIMNLAGTLFAKTPAQGADTPTWVATSPDLDGVSGKDLEERKERADRFPDDLARARLWSICETMTSSSKERQAARAVGV